MNDVVTFDRIRIARLAQLLGALSIGDGIDAAKINVDTRDELADFEEMLNIFAEEYSDALAENEELNRRRLETIERQQATIAELSVPIIDVWDDVVMLPIVGIVDTQRSVDMTQRLLRRVAAGNARCVIIDLTGIDVVDTSATDHLIRMMRSVQLLGAFCVMSGISPNIAQTMVQLDVDMGAVAMVRSMKDALRLSFRKLDALERGEG